MGETGQTQQEKRYGAPADSLASDAYPADFGASRDAKDYVLVTKIHPSGLRIEEQVLKTDLEESEDYEGLSLESEEVVEAHPARNRPTSDLTEEEAKAEGREVGQG
jgi:hypothetical protein